MMEQQSKARYRKGQEFYYDFAYSSEIRNSRILSGEFDVSELDDLLEIKQKRLQMLKDELEDVGTVQKLSKQTAFNKGQQWNEDDRSREKRVTLEAKIDVVRLEIAKIEEAIEEAEAEKEKHDVLPCMPNGPEGNNSVPGSIGEGYVDGQWCEHVGNAGLVITDERSKYRGMSVMDYTEHIAKPWIIACKEYRTKVTKEGKDLEVNHGPGRGSHHVPWPEWDQATIKNHLASNEQAQPKSAAKIKRTKR